MFCFLRNSVYNAIKKKKGNAIATPYLAKKLPLWSVIKSWVQKSAQVLWFNKIKVLVLFIGWDPYAYLNVNREK